MEDQRRLEILAIIPARGDSKGIPRKNVRLLAGKPLIAYSIEAAKQSKYLDKVVVSTEDKEIAEIAKQHGAEVIERPLELARDESLTIDVISHVMDVLKASNYIPSLILLLQPTSPLRKVEDIDNAIDLFLRNKAESVISVCEMEHPLHWSLKIEGGYLKPVFDEKYLRTRRQDLEKTYIPNGAIFVSRTQTLLSSNTFYCNYTIPYIMPQERSVDIDNEIDFVLAELLMEERHGIR